MTFVLSNTAAITDINMSTLYYLKCQLLHPIFQGSIDGDSNVALCCPSCALCQMERELLLRGLV